MAATLAATVAATEAAGVEAFKDLADSYLGAAPQRRFNTLARLPR